MKKNFTLFLLICYVSIFSQKYESVNDSIYQSAVKQRDAQEYEKSIESLSKISKYSPENEKATVEKARVLYLQKKYTDAEKTLQQLDKSSLDNENLSGYYNLLGNLYDDNNQKDKAIETYNEGIAKYPNSYLLYFNRAVTNINLKKNQEAYQDVLKSIEIYPSFAKAHYILGLLAFDNGNLTEGTLALTTSILLDNGGNITQNAIKILNVKLSSKFEEPEKRFDIEGSELFSNIESVLRKQYALNKEYKLKSEIDIAYIRQLQALLSELPKITERKGFFTEKYVDFYTKIWNNNQFENLTYYFFKDYENEGIKKMVNKKMSDLKSFQSWMLPEIFSTVMITKSPYTKEKVTSFSEDDYIGYGKIVDGKKQGNWIYNFSYGNKAMEVGYDKGEFSGDILSYYDNGKQSGKATYKNGKLEGKGEYYYDNGNLKLKKEFLNGKIQNKMETYYYLGGLKCYEMLNQDVKDGKEECYYSNGNKKSIANYVKGNIDGNSETYYPDSALQNKYFYIANYYNGDKIDYYPNQKIQSLEKFKKGIPDGDFIQNSANGDNISTFKLSNGKPVIMTKYIGKMISEVREFSGEKVVKQTNYTQGKPYIEYDFDGSDGNERINTYKIFEASGNALPEVKVTREKPFQIKLANGKNYIEGMYDKKGLKTGAWKYYNAITGVLESMSTYQANKLNGKYEEYYANGKLKSSVNMVNDKKEGIYTTYFINGNKSGEYTYVNDTENGESKIYFKNGKLKTAYFTDNGKIQGTYEYYDNKGNLTERAKFIDNDMVKDDLYYNGKIVSTIDYGKNGKIVYTQKDGSENVEATINNGNFEGDYIVKNKKNGIIFDSKLINSKKYGTATNYNPNGTISVKADYKNGELYGDYLANNFEGKLLSKSTYHNNLEYGTFQKFFHEGFKQLETEYFEDKKNGKETYFGNNGEELLSIIYDNDAPISYQKQGDTKPTMFDGGNAKITANYKNGKPGLEINFANGELNGNFNLFSDAGTPLIQSKYKDGIVDGNRKMYFLSGKLYSEENFKDGDFDGTRTVYYASGKPKIEANYYGDTLYGNYTEYNEAGAKTVQKKYENDILIDYK